MARLGSLNKQLKSMQRKDLEKSTSDGSSELRRLRSDRRAKALEFKKTRKKREIRSVLKSICNAERVELCFIMDSTGSMSPHITRIRTLKLRLAFVAYRDMDDENLEIVDWGKVQIDMFIAVPTSRKGCGCSSETGGVGLHHSVQYVGGVPQETVPMHAQRIVCLQEVLNKNQIQIATK